MQNIKQLIELFMEGKTSLEQERTLYAYFAQRDIAPELEEYRQMFQGFASICQTATGGADAPVSQPMRKRLRLPLRIAICAAASVALVFGILTIVDNQEEKQLERLYGGSYMIVNGERTNDLQKMQPEIERILAYAEQMERSMSISGNLQMIEENIIIEE